MYTFSDPVTLKNIHDLFSAFSRIGEHVNINAQPTSITLSCINSSLTVVGKVSLHKPLFTGNGVSQIVHVKSKAADFIFKRIDTETVSSVSLQFKQTGNGQEYLEIELLGTTGMRKTFQLPCLQTTMRPGEFLPVGNEYYVFSCSPAKLRDSIGSTQAGADELKIGFHANTISFSARKKAKSQAEIAESHHGLRTNINLPPQEFRQLAVKMPLQLELKLKELKVMLNYFTLLGENALLIAKFSAGQHNTSVDFDVQNSFPCMEFTFRFMAKMQVKKESQTWLVRGTQPDWLNPTKRRRIAPKERNEEAQLFVEQDENLEDLPVPPLTLNQPVYQAQNIPSAMALSSTNSHTHAQDIGSPTNTAPNSPAKPGSMKYSPSFASLLADENQTQHPQSQSQPEPEPQPQPQQHSEDEASDLDPEAIEIGPTQKSSSVRGLFD